MKVHGVDFSKVNGVVVNKVNGILFTRDLIKVINEAVNITEALWKDLTGVIVKIVNEVVNVASSYQKSLSYSKSLGEAIQVTESHALDLFTTAGAIIKMVNETVQASETYQKAKGIVRSVSDTLGISEAYQKARSLLHVIADTVRSSESLTQFLQTAPGAIIKVINETVQSSEATQRTRGLIKTVNETVNVNEFPPTPRGLWRWNWSASDLSNPWSFIAFLEEFGFNQVYIYAYDVHLYGTTNANNFNIFINACHSRGIEVWGIINQGNVEDNDPPGPIAAADEALIQAYLNYQSSHQHHFDGLMFDIETLTNIIDTMDAYMTAVLAFSYSGQTLVSQNWTLGIYIDPPYYLTNPRGTDYEGAVALYTWFDRILLNTYRPTAAEIITTAQDGPDACADVGIPYMIGLEALPGWENSFDGTYATYLSIISDVDDAFADDPYYGGTYLDAYSYVSGW